MNFGFFISADFKAMYSVTGSCSPESKSPCPWCETPSSLLDRAYEELKRSAPRSREIRILLAELKLWTTIKYLRALSDSPCHHRGNTFSQVFLRTRRRNNFSSDKYRSSYTPYSYRKFQPSSTSFEWKFYA